MQSNSICMPNPNMGSNLVTHERLVHNMRTASSTKRLLVSSGGGLTSLQCLYTNAISTDPTDTEQGRRRTKVIRTRLEVVRRIETLCEILGLDRTLRCLGGGVGCPLLLLVDGGFRGRSSFCGSGRTEEPKTERSLVCKTGKERERTYMLEIP